MKIEKNVDIDSCFTVYDRRKSTGKWVELLKDFVNSEDENVVIYCDDKKETESCYSSLFHAIKRHKYENLKLVISRKNLRVGIIRQV